MPKKKMIGYEVSISGRDDGTVEAVYVAFSAEKVARTEEAFRDQILVDYDARGEIVGIEILAPVKITRLTRFVDKSRRPNLRKFLRQSVSDKFLYS